MPYDGIKVDVWSMGIVLYILLVGNYPFKGKDQELLYHNIMEGNFEIPDYISLGAQNLITKILNIDPFYRPTCF